MYTLVIGRAFPRKETGMMGIFEFEQAAALSKYGMKTVYAFCDTRSVKRLRKYNYEEFVHENVPVYGYHYPIGGIPVKFFDQLKYIKYKRLLTRIIKNHGKPSVIHIHFPLLTLNMKVWGFLDSLDIPIIVTEHWSKVQKKELEPYRIELLSQVVMKSSKFITVNNEMKSSVEDLIKRDESILELSNMVSNEFHYDKNMPKSERYRFIAIGRLVKEKRYNELIRIFDTVFKDNENVELLIVGDGPERSKLSNMINSLKLNDKVRITGFIPRKQVVYELQNSHAYVSSSDVETFGVPYIEALACGKPIIGKLNGVIEKLLPNENCIYTYRELSDLATSMEKVYSDRKSHDGYSVSQKTMEKYGEENIINKIIDIYTEAREGYKSE